MCLHSYKAASGTSHGRGLMDERVSWLKSAVCDSSSCRVHPPPLSKANLRRLTWALNSVYDLLVIQDVEHKPEGMLIDRVLKFQTTQLWTRDYHKNQIIFIAEEPLIIGRMKG